MTKLDTKWQTIGDGGGWVREQPDIAHVDLASDQMQQSYTLQLLSQKKGTKEHQPSESYK